MLIQHKRLIVVPDEPSKHFREDRSRNIKENFTKLTSESIKFHKQDGSLVYHSKQKQLLQCLLSILIANKREIFLLNL